MGPVDARQTHFKFGYAFKKGLQCCARTKARAIGCRYSSMNLASP